MGRFLNQRQRNVEVLRLALKRAKEPGAELASVRMRIRELGFLPLERTGFRAEDIDELVELGIVERV